MRIATTGCRWRSGEWFKHMIMPWIALSVLFIGVYSSVLRSTILGMSSSAPSRSSVHVARLGAIPIPDPNENRAREPTTVTGEPPNPIDPPTGSRGGLSTTKGWGSVK
jgi:hypothetical protein